MVNTINAITMRRMIDALDDIIRVFGAVPLSGHQGDPVTAALGKLYYVRATLLETALAPVAVAAP